jgi:hypothetical protein
MTSDNLAARGLQHNTVCALCHQVTEDTRHLLINCSFLREVMRLLWFWFAMEGSPTLWSQDQDPPDWLCVNAQRANPACNKEATRILLYHW